MISFGTPPEVHPHQIVIGGKKNQCPPLIASASASDFGSRHFWILFQTSFHTVPRPVPDQFHRIPGPVSIHSHVPQGQKKQTGPQLLGNLQAQRKKEVRDALKKLQYYHVDSRRSVPDVRNRPFTRVAVPDVRITAGRSRPVYRPTAIYKVDSTRTVIQFQRHGCESSHSQYRLESTCVKCPCSASSMPI